jgi:hypothetical protein
MKEPYNEVLTKHIGPESCIYASNDVYDALTGVRTGQVWSRENYTRLWGADVVGVYGRQHWLHRYGEVQLDPAWSETLSTCEKLFTREPGYPMFGYRYGTMVRVGNPKGVIRQ